MERQRERLSPIGVVRGYMLAHCSTWNMGSEMVGVLMFHVEQRPE